MLATQLFTLGPGKPCKPIMPKSPVSPYKKQKTKNTICRRWLFFKKNSLM